MDNERLEIARKVAEQYAGVKMMLELGIDLADVQREESLVAACSMAMTINEPIAKRVLAEASFELGRRGAGAHFKTLALQPVPAELVAQVVPADAL